MTNIEIITTAIAFLSLLTVMYQLWNNTRVTKADFIYSIRNDFYSKKSKFIMFFIEYDFIDFKENKEKGKNYDSYFAIDKNKVKSLSEQFKVFETFAEKSDYTIHIQDMDNYVLGYLNDIGEYYKKRIIDFDYIFNSFGYYIVRVSENQAIKDYIKWDRNVKLCINDYKLFDKIADKFK